ncbi:hypothetical protein [Diaphorobacter aerolatus]|uniref:Uncharacterized protein n=1 Tax=Diaphorobacter aerolatus TaxID=1288495 RepID=A0A7H0GKW0_9BURK|nr:hypothetical protein [Diaphorobacter aerolatus]QNP48926.1 hypothetical protein H9K75_01625 [Diaphorobacter aerolatus]
MQTRLTLRQRLGMCWLMLALVLSPALGLVHQVAHGAGSSSHASMGGTSPAALEQGLETPHASASIADQTLGAMQQLFGAHTKAECVLLDQIALGHALVAHVPVLAEPLPEATPLAELSAEPLGQHAAPFRARGPPVLLSA